MGTLKTIATASNAEQIIELLQYNNGLLEYLVGFGLFATLVIILYFIYKFLNMFF